MATAVQGDDLLPRAGPAHDDDGRLALWPGLVYRLSLAIAQAVVVESVEGLPPLQHDVVGDVHEGTDGAHAGQHQPPLDGMGRGSNLHALDERGHVAVAEVWVFDLHFHLPGDGRALRHPVGGGQPYLLSRQGSHLPGHADHGKAPRQVGRQVQVQHRVARPQSQFLLGADHPLGRDPPDLGRLQGENPAVVGVAVNEPRPGGGEDHLLAAIARLQVGCTGDHLLLPALAIVHRDQGQAVGVGMAADRHDFAHEDPVPIPIGPHPLDGGHLQPGQGQPLGQFLHVQGQVHVFAQPAKGYSHRSILRKSRG